MNAIGGISSCITQQMTNGSIEAKQVIFDGLVGGISGAIGATGLGIVGSAIAGFAIGFGGSVLNDVVMNRDIDWIRAAISGGIGAIFGVIGTKVGGETTKLANSSNSFIQAGKAVALDVGNRAAKHAMYLAAFNAIQFANATTFVASTAIGIAGTAALAFYDYYSK